MARVKGEICKKIGFFSGAVQRPTGTNPYSTQAGNGTRYQIPQGNGWQAQNPEHHHKVIINYMARFLEKYAIPYFSKLLIAGNKTVRNLPKYGGNLQGKRDICVHHILEKCMKPNCYLYHAQEK